MSQLRDVTRARAMQEEVRRALGVDDAFDAETECRRRIDFLADYLRRSGARGFVLGISGGVDSTVAGRLASLACRSFGGHFIALRLPYGRQSDADDARRALEFIEPDETLEIDIKPATDALHERSAPEGAYTPAKADFVKGNVKARQRMTAQYAVAGWSGSLVVGTDHAAEAVMGFFTKFGDGAADVVPLAGLTKGRVRAIGRQLGAPSALIDKVPTADLEDNRPGLPDEQVYGVTYDEIDAYLLGEKISDASRELIESAYDATRHKRALPVGPGPR